MKAIASCCCALMLIGVASSVARGDFIPTVTIANVSSELGAPVFDRGAGYLVSDAGLDVVTGTHSIIPDGMMWLSHGTLRDPQDPLPAQVVFDLGDVYDLESLAVWNYNEFDVIAGSLTSRGANSVNISVGTDPGSLLSLGNFTFTQAPGIADVNFRQDIALGHLPNTSTVRYVALDILSTHAGDYEFAGLSKVRFTAAAIPEPAAGLLLPLGAILG